MQADIVLELGQVCVDAGDTAFAQDISFQISAGEVFGLLGPNGAGKTTILRVLYHASRLRSGVVRLHGKPQSEWSRREWSSHVGALVQGSGLLTGLTPMDIVEIGLSPLSLDPLEHSNRLQDALELAGLWEKRHQHAESLSGGELQRCYFAQLLAMDPEIYVLDEPTNHLDLHYQLILLDEVKRRGKTTIITLHDLGLAARYCDRVAIMQAGRIVQQGPVSDVLSRDQIAASYRVHAQLRGSTLDLEGPIVAPR